MSKKYMQKNKKSIKANALGDDRNLAENGMSSHYWYSVGDGFRLVLWLRQQYLNYDNIPVANIGEEYVAFRENNSRIFVTDPYYSSNFAQYLIDDITRITATGNFSNNTIIVGTTLENHKNQYRLRK